MTTLTEKFTALEAQLAAEAAEADTDRNVTNVKLQAIFDTLDTILINNAANTRAILAAIGQNSPCMPCPTPPIFVPPIGTTPLPVDTDACKRAQAFLNFMDGVFTVLDLASAVGIGFNPSLVTDAFNQVIANLGGVDAPETISFPEAVQLVGDLVSYIATNLLVGHTLVGVFTPLYADLRQALYSAGGADSAKSAYDAVISASSLTSQEQAVLITAAYGAAYTYFFDPTSEPNLAGIDGNLCNEGPCTELESVAVTATDPSFPSLTNRQCIIPTMFADRRDFFSATDFSESVVVNEASAGTTIELLSGAGCRVVMQNGSITQEFLTVGVPFTIPVGTVNWFIDDVTAGLTLSGAYTVEICVPE